MAHFTVLDRRNSIMSDDSRGSTPPQKAGWCERLSAIFQINHQSYDVALQEKRIVWSALDYIKKSQNKAKTSKRKSILQRMRRGSKAGIEEAGLDTGGGDDTGILLTDLFGVELRRNKMGGSSKNSPGYCAGLELHTFVRKPPNKLRQQVILLGHPSEDVCHKWKTRLQEVIDGYSDRPTKFKAFLQPYAGHKTAKSVYETKVEPMFKAAGCEIDMVYVKHNEHIKQEMIHMDMSEYDAVLCIGGDGTVNKVINHLINKSQNTEPWIGFSPRHCEVPVGIIPLGVVNQIAYSVMGTNDPVTAAIHIILGHRHNTDICSVWVEDKLEMWSFNCHYGYFGNTLTFASRYVQLGSRMFDAAFVKALSKSKLQKYEVDIQYLSANDGTNPNDGNICSIGCQKCEANNYIEEDRGSVYSDEVETLDPLDQSGTSSTIMDLSRENPRKSIKGHYLSLSILSNSGRCEFAPHGCSPCAHLSDGTMDLVLVSETNRKEFTRYLKRHGNTKNQFDFPFVQVYRCTEIVFRQRLEQTWKHNDWEFDELKYEVERQEKHGDIQGKRSKSIDVICDTLDDDDDDDDPNGVVELDDVEDDDDYDQVDLDGKGSNRSNKGSAGSSKHSEGRSNSVANIGQNNQYRPSWQESERARRRKMQRKKEEKRRAKAEAKSKSVWNVDNEVYTWYDVTFKVHRGLVTLFGQGISPDFDHGEVGMGCLSIIK